MEGNAWFKWWYRRKKYIKHNYSIPRVYAFMVRVEGKKNLVENLTKTGAQLETLGVLIWIQFNYIKCLHLLLLEICGCKKKRKRTHLDAWQLTFEQGDQGGGWLLIVINSLTCTFSDNNSDLCRKNRFTEHDAEGSLRLQRIRSVPLD